MAKRNSIGLIGECSRWRRSSANRTDIVHTRQASIKRNPSKCENIKTFGRRCRTMPRRGLIDHITIAGDALQARFRHDTPNITSRQGEQKQRLCSRLLCPEPTPWASKPPTPKRLGAAVIHVGVSWTAGDRPVAYRIVGATIRLGGAGSFVVAMPQSLLPPGSE